MRHYQIAVVPGDGIEPEVITESVQTLALLAQLHGGFNWICNSLTGAPSATSEKVP